MRFDPKLPSSADSRSGWAVWGMYCAGASGTFLNGSTIGSVGSDAVHQFFRCIQHRVLCLRAEYRRSHTPFHALKAFVPFGDEGLAAWFQAVVVRVRVSCGFQSRP